MNRYSVEERDECVLVFGSVPLHHMSALLKLAPNDAVMSPDVARMVGANFAFGPGAALDRLRAKLAPGAIAAAEATAAGAGIELSAAATRWLAAGRRGISSETMFTHFTGVDALGGLYQSHPHDPDDLDRCLQLLEDVPEFRSKLPTMASVSPAWAALVARWDDIERAHLDEVGLGWTKAKRAPKTYALMRAILDPVRTS